MAFYDPASREAEAVAEIAATRLGSGIAAGLVAGFLLLLASGPVYEVTALLKGRSAIFAPVEIDHRSSWLTRARSVIDEIEDRFDERSALVRAVRPPTQLALTRTTGYGNARVVAGRDGWLFYRESVDHLIAASRGGHAAGDPAAALIDLGRGLARHKVTMVVLPVPVKPAVHPEHLSGSHAAAPIRRPGELETYRRIEEAGFGVVDLAPRFARDAALAPLYAARDTHWLPQTVEIAAREVALQLRAVADLPPGDPERFAEEPAAISMHGDLVSILGLPHLQTLYAPEPAEVRRVEPRGSWPPGHAPVLLLGDSFSAIYADGRLASHAGLADRLAFQLGLPVDQIVEVGGGAKATRARLAAEMARDPHRLDGVRAVVVEFAARELSQGNWQEVPLPPPAD